MYQHLTESAKEVLKQAEIYARRDLQEYVGTEHVLLAIIDHADNPGACILANCDITSDRVEDEIKKITRQSMEETWVLGKLPGSPHFKQVIALAIQEAERVQDQTVGTEYLLLGLLREKNCVAERTLCHLGLNLDRARQEVIRFKNTAP